jgi:hypothetical protein
MTDVSLRALRDCIPSSARKLTQVSCINYNVERSGQWDATIPEKYEENFDVSSAKL